MTTKRRNPVAKFNNRINRPKVMASKKYDYKRHPKHKKTPTERFNEE